MQRRRAPVVAVMVAACCVVASFATSVNATPIGARTSYLLAVSSDSAARVVADALRDVGVDDVAAHFGEIPFVEATLSDTEATEWSHRAGVVSVEPNGVVYTATDQAIPAPVGENWNAAGNWGLDRVDQTSPALNQIYSYANTGAGVDVYVVDTGIRRTHTEFTGRVGTGFYATGLTSTDDGCGHGTHVAGVVAGTTFGVAKSANIIPVRVFPGGSVAACDGGTTVSALVEGINFIKTNHQNGTPAVANMSLGLQGYSSFLDTSVRSLIDDGVSVIVAAGNDGRSISGGTTTSTSPTPACTVGTITVGATGSYGNTYAVTDVDAEAGYSNFGACVDIYAPGTYIKSSWPYTSADPRDPDTGRGNGFLSDSAWGLSSGTSMAAPFVTGAVAQLLQTTPSLTPAQVGELVLLNGQRDKLTLVHGSVANANQSPNLFLFTCTTVCVPGVPTAVVATRGNAQASISWTPPTSDGGTAITSYTATSTPDGAACFVNVPATSCTIPGLINGRSYSVAVAASNAVGVGPQSTAVSVVPASVPAAAAAPTATSSDQSAVVTWVAPDTGGAAISSYTVTATPGGATCATQALTCTVPGLVNGTAYTFSVQATNELGVGPASPASSAVIPSASWVFYPGLVSALAGNKSVALSWTAAELTSGTPTGYVVKNAAGVVVCTTTALTCRVSGLANGSSQVFSVEATSITLNSPVLSVPKVIVGGLVQKGNAAKRKSVVLLSKIASTYSKGKVTWKTVSGTCRISGKYLYAPTKKGTCVLRVSVAKASPFPAQRLTIRLNII
jgi:subtilisin family serine protease